MPTTIQHSARADEELYQLLRYNGHCDLLLDRTLGNPLSDAIAAERLAEAPVPINPPAIKVEDDACPLLVRLRIDNLVLLDASIELAQRQTAESPPRRTVCAWLFGAAVDAQAGARHLQRQMIITGADHQKFALRFHDPRVMPWLAHILRGEQMARLFGPFGQWVWMDRTTQLRRLNRPDAVANDNPLSLIAVTREQDAAIERIELLNEALAAMTELKRPWPLQDDHTLDAWLLKAQQSGHTERRDQLAYVLHAALVHPNFDLHPDVADAIASAKRDGVGLCAALEAFDDAFWESVKGQGRLN